MMGYPMSWQRFRARNRLWGTYSLSWGKPNPYPGFTNEAWAILSAISGDAQRLEDDSLDDRHLRMYAAISGASETQVARLLRALFYLPEPDCDDCQKAAAEYPWRDYPTPTIASHRCAFHQPSAMADRVAPFDHPSR